MLRRKAYMNIKFERTREFIAQIYTRRLARDAPNHLAHQPSERDRMVAMGRAWHPPRFHLRQRGRERVPVVERAELQRFAYGGKTRAMAQQKSHRQLVLARLRKLGPVLRHGRVDINEALVYQAMRANRGDALGGRVNVDERVARSE